MQMRGGAPVPVLSSDVIHTIVPINDSTVPSYLRPARGFTERRFILVQRFYVSQLEKQLLEKQLLSKHISYLEKARKR